MTSKTLAGPMVHLNGTSRDELLRQYSDALYALSNALDAIGRATPHGRDYYIQENADKELDQAKAEHRSRLDRILAIQAEYEQLVERIC